MAKKYRTLIDAIGHGGVVCAGAIFEFDEKKGEYQDKNSRWWYHKEFVETSPLIFEEVVEKEFVWTDELVVLFASEVEQKKHYGKAMEKFIDLFKISHLVPAGKGTANDVLNTDFINSSLESQEKFMNKLAEDAILSGSPLNTEKEYSDKRFDALKKENYYNDLRDADKWRKKERIEVDVRRGAGNMVLVSPSYTIQQYKFSIIKQAIEDIINNEYDEYVFQPKTNYKQ